MLSFLGNVESPIKRLEGQWSELSDGTGTHLSADDIRWLPAQP